MEQVRFEQFVFFRQWHRLKHHANERGVLMFGDLPIFVAHDSADVWAHRDQFAVHADGSLVTVAGVPPDYFSETGQLWGNPHYDWSRMAVDNFRWWKQRFRSQAELMDLLRVDHFRGFEAYWEIRAGAKTAVEGRWVKAPGDALFTTLRAHFPRLRIVAEDLGIITPEVNALRFRHGFPGMKVLQFAFDGGADNPYLPHNCEIDSVVYTGTHDNATTVGWFSGLTERQRKHVYGYLGNPQDAMPWVLIRAALASVARLAVVPMQDLLALDNAHRMNTPGTVEDNWRWRFDWDQIDPGLAARVRALVEMYGR
jgi:4-alpha-glucanotransferase